MHGFLVFLGKEFREITRTWRMWVLPLIAIGMGLLSPIAAKVTPALLESLTTDQPGFVIQIPDPTTVDAFIQFDSNFVQTVLFAVIISMAGMVSSERKNGTAVLVLTKPISRKAMIVAKVFGNQALLIVSTVLGAVVCWAGTQVFFDNTLVGEFIAAASIWFVFAAMLVSVMAFLSVLVNSQAGAAGIGIVVYLALAILGGWGPARDYSPAGLMSAGDRLLLGQDPSLLWPILTASIMAVACTWAAAVLFGRKEL